MVRRTKEEALETRNRILDAAEHVFYEKGVSRTSLADIAQTAGVTDLVLTKLDGSAKGGVVVPILDRLKLPIAFVGVGEGVDDLIPFDPEAFVDGLLDV